MPNLINNSVMAISSEQFYGNSSEIAAADKDNASPKQNKFLQNPQNRKTPTSERKIKPEFKPRNNLYRSQTPTYSSCKYCVVLLLLLFLLLFNHVTLKH